MNERTRSVSERLIALFVSFVLVLSMLPAGMIPAAWAEETETETTTEPVAQYSVMTHNLLSAVYKENNYDTAGTAIPQARYEQLYAVLQQYMPDVVAFQECDPLWHNDLLDDLNGKAESLGVKSLSELGYAAVATDDHDISTNKNPLYYNDAKLDVVVDGWIPYNASEAGTDTPWCFTWGVFAAEGSEKPLFAVSSTHIVSNAGAGVDPIPFRKQMITTLVSYMKGIEAEYGCPVILMGDFNTDAVDESYGAFELGTKLLSSRDVATVVEGMGYMSHNVLGSVPSATNANADGVIDHIMISTTGIVAEKYVNSVDTCTYSDHAAQRMTFHLTDEACEHVYGEWKTESENYISHVRTCACGMAERENHDWTCNDADQTVCAICAAEMPESAGKLGCYCAGNGDEEHVCEELVWTPWYSTTHLPYAEGNYYLMDDVECTAINYVDANATVRVDLNGKKVTTKASRIYNVRANSGCDLTITDRSANHDGTIIVTADSSALGVLLEMGNGNRVNLYGGILDASDVVSTSTYGVAVTMVDAGTTLNIYGGTIKGGYATGTSSHGASIWMNNGPAVNMYGGLITGGKVDGCGGNVYVGGGSTFTMKDGTISGGIANNTTDASKKNCGGNVQVSGTFYMDGGIIENGSIGSGGSMGGNVSLGTVGAKFYMTDGIIRGGKCAIWGGSNVRITGGSVFQMTGGTIDGTGANNSSVFFEAATSRMIVGGSAKVMGAAVNIKFNNAANSIEVTDDIITSGENAAQIWVSAELGRVVVKSGATEAMNNVFRLDNAAAGTGICHANGTMVAKYVHTGCYCAGNGTEAHVCENLNWIPWTNSSTLPYATGNYYLTGDMTMTGPTWPAAGANVKLDLNGYTLTYNGTKVLNMAVYAGATYTITDTSANKDGKIVIGGTYGVNAVSTFLEIKKGNVFNMYAGTVDASAVSFNTVYGATISMIYQDTANPVFNMYGGTIIGANATGDNGRGGTFWMTDGSVLNVYGGTIKGGSAGGAGGNICLEKNATVNLHGGIIEGGQAVSGGNVYIDAEGASLNIYSGTIQNGSATRGGNIYMNAGNVTMEGGTISGGTSKADGGSVWMNYTAEFTLNDGTITGGQAALDGNYYCGGNIHVMGTAYINGGVIENGTVAAGGSMGGNVSIVNGKVIMTDGVVRGGKCANWGGSNIRIGNNATFQISGGIVDGTNANNNSVFFENATGKMIVGGSAKVKGAAVNIKFNNAANSIEVADDIITSGENAAQIWVTAEMGRVVVKSGATEAMNNVFRLDSAAAGTGIYHVDGTMVAKYARTGCYCAGNGTEAHVCENLNWIPWTNSSTLPYATGNYYLTGDMTMTGPTWPAAGANVKLDLNGYTLTYNGSKVLNMAVYAGATYTITDTSANKDGKIVIGGTYGVNSVGTFLELKKGNVFNMYAGTVDASAVSFNTVYGATISMIYQDTANPVFNMYGGTIIGANATGDNGRGGTFWMTDGSVLNVYGGTIKGGSAGGAGGNICLEKNATVNLHGGIIEGGQATTGGNVYIDAAGASLNIYSGTIQNGSATRGGNIYMNAGNVTMEGGTISGGTSKADGGSVWMNYTAEFTLNDGTITGGQAALDGKNYCGGNIHTMGTLYINGGVVENGSIAAGGSMGGNISVVNGKVIMTDGIIRGGKCAIWGGSNVRIGNNATFQISGGIVDGTNANNNSVFFEHATAKMIVGGSAKIKGAAVNIKFGNVANSIEVADDIITSGENAAQIWVSANAGRAIVNSGATAEIAGIFRIDGGDTNHLKVVYNEADASVVVMKETYTVTWLNDDGSLLKSELVDYGTVPAYGETPAKESTGEFSYTFAGWDKEVVAVTGDVTYTATYTASTNIYVITWVIEGVETNEPYTYGDTPEYKGETPTKAEDENYTYEFSSWSPAIAPVTGDATYTAQFTATAKIKKFDFDGATMTLGSNLDMSFYIEPSDLQEGESYYVVITREYADSRADAQFRIEQADWSWHTGYKQYYVTFKGIAAKEMTDSIRLVVYNSKDQAVSNEWVDSVRDYVMRMLTKEEKKAKPNAVDMTMFVEMLNYGAAAQVYFKNYNIEDLANSQLTESQKGYALTEVPMENHVVKGNGYNGTSLTLESQILTKIFFKSTVVNQSMKAVVSFTDHYGNLKTKEIAGSEFTKNPNDPDWFIPITEVAIADYGQLVTVTIYDAEGNEVTSAADSIESYAARNSNGDDLYKAIMAFGIAAKAYFHK